MKVTHIITDLDMGGAETMLYKFLEESSGSSIKYSVISLSDMGIYGDKLEKIGVNVYCLELGGTNGLLCGLFRLIRVLSRLKPNVVQSWMYHANIAATLSSLFLSIPVIWNIRHSLHDMSSERRMTRILIRAGSLLSVFPCCIVFNSSESLEQHQKIAYSQKKLMVIPNGFDLNKFHELQEAKQCLIQELSLLQDAYLVGVVARYHKAKGYKYLIKAAKEVLYKNNKVHFVLIGKDVDCQNNELAVWINNIPYPENVHLLGMREDIERIIPAFDLLVNPSTTEAFSNVIGEAMACKVPCVVTDVGESRKIVDIYGAVVPAKNSMALAQAILDMLSLDNEKLKELGKGARNRIMKNYSIDAVAKQYEKLYQQYSR